MKNYKVMIDGQNEIIVKADGVTVDTNYHTIQFKQGNPTGETVAWFNTNNIVGWVEQTREPRKK